MGSIRDVKSKIMEEINAFSGDVAFCIRDTATGEEIADREDEIFPTASTVKIFALGALMERVDQKKVSLGDELTMTEAVQVRGSGVMKEFTLGTKYTVRDVAMMMIIVSDNTATNMIVDLVGGTAEVNNWIARCGLRKSQEPIRIDFEKLENDAKRFGIATAREFVDYLLLMKNGPMLSAASKEVFFDMMKRQQCLDQFPRYIPYNPYAPELHLECPVCVASKTGFMVGIRCDVGFVREGAKEVCYAVLTQNCKDESFQVENEGSRLVGRIGKLVYDAVFTD